MGCTQSKAPTLDSDSDPLPLLNLLILGLPNSGKSTILSQLKGQSIQMQSNPSSPSSPNPHYQLDINSFILNNKIRLIAFQVAGRACSSWHNYYQTADIVLFVVDVVESASYGRIGQLIREMDGVLKKGSRIVIVFNKIDVLVGDGDKGKEKEKKKETEEIEQVTEFLNKNVSGTANQQRFKQLQKFHIDNLQHEVYTCKCSGKDRIGVNNLMRKIFGFAYQQVYGQAQGENQKVNFQKKGDREEKVQGL